MSEAKPVTLVLMTEMAAQLEEFVQRRMDTCRYEEEWDTYNLWDAVDQEIWYTYGKPTTRTEEV